MALAETGGETSGAGETAVEFGEQLCNESVRIAADELRATVAEDDTRNLETVGEAVAAWEDYLDEKENQMLVMEEKESGDKLVLPHEHRWTSEYRSRTYARLKAVERYVKRSWGGNVPTTLLTLTAPHKDSQGEYRPYESVLNDIKEGWDKARRVIRRETEGVETEYLAVYEPHKDGYPHLHVLVFGVARPSLGEKITEYWVDRYVEGASRDAQDVTVERGRSVDLENPAAYIMKYLSKSLVREGESKTAKESLPTVSGYREFSALLWATGNRMYSMSEGLSRAVKESEPEGKEAEGDWEFVGTVSGVEAGFYVGDEAEKLGRYLRGSPGQQIPPRRGDSGGRSLPIRGGDWEGFGG